ncbi:hypothetical protein EV715DRAFT_257982, partial [Schizophyllum commune]
MLFSDLPAEIVDQILCALRTVDLYHVALVNHDLGAPATRVLYHDIEEPTPRASIRCLHTLAACPHLAILVRSLSIDWASFDRAACVTANAYRLLRRALNRTSRLVRLALELPTAQEPIWVLFEARFQLRAFESTFSPGHGLAAFLTSQPFITELGIRTRGSSLPLPTFALPRLSQLRAAHAAPGLLADIIAGRPVAAVSLPLYAGAASSAALDAISRSTAHIKKFTALAFDARPPQDVLEEIAARVPHLIALHLIAFLGQYDSKSLLDSSRILRRLPQLEFITCMAASSMATTEDDEMRIAAAWRESCPKLRAVILPRGRVCTLPS